MVHVDHILQIQLPLISPSHYSRDVAAGSNEQQLYSQARKTATCLNSNYHRFVLLADRTEYCQEFPET